MNKHKHKKRNSVVTLTALSIIVAFASGCSSNDDGVSPTDVSNTSGTTETGSESVSVDPTKFVDGALASEAPVLLVATNRIHYQQ